MIWFILGKEAVFNDLFCFVLQMVTVEETAVIGCSTVPDIPKFVDIDSDDKDPLLCSLYAPDIYYNMRVSEVIPRLFRLLRKLVSQRDKSLIPCASVSLLF